MTRGDASGVTAFRPAMFVPIFIRADALMHQPFRRSSLTPVAVALALLALGVPVSGCRRQGDSMRSATPAATASRGMQAVRLSLTDGSELNGLLYGSASPSAVVLMADTGQSADVWRGLAEDLAASGYRVLALDSGAGDAEQRAAGVRAAVAYLQGKGAARVALVGEGAAGIAVIEAGAGDLVGGVAAVSAPADAGSGSDPDVRAALGRVDGPVLVLDALGDAEQARASQRLYDAAGEPRTLALIPGTARGADLFAGASATQARALLLEFLRAAFAERTA